MRGTMLWFNVDKGHGFIRTERDERLYVARSDFLPDHPPASRCKGREVTFERREVEGDVRAVAVAFHVESDPPRARLRHARGGRPL
jgi:cold shock CspA family protein